MILHIQADGTVTLDDPDDLKRFKVRVNRPASAYRDIAARNPDTLRFSDTTTAWVTVDAIATLSGRSTDPVWRTALQDMLAFCRTKGWLSLDGAEVQAHVEWNPSATM